MKDLAGCLTRGELCDLLRISPKTSRKMDRDGTGPRAIHVTPRITRYAVTEVVDYMNAHGLAVPAELRL